jgi:pyruvate kinase
VIPVYFPFDDGHHDVYRAAIETASEVGHIQPGERVTVTTGDISGSTGLTNTLKVLEL